MPQAARGQSAAAARRPGAPRSRAVCQWPRPGAFRIDELFQRSTLLVVRDTRIVGKPWVFARRPRRTLWRNVSVDGFRPDFPEKLDKMLCRPPRYRDDVYEGVIYDVSVSSAPVRHSSRISQDAVAVQHEPVVSAQHLR